MAKAPRSLHVEAVVLRHTDWGEADRLLSVFSREQGKLRCIAKGARRMRSRKAGHLEPFTRVTLLLSRSHDWWIISQAEAVDVYMNLRESLVHTAYAATAVELLDRFIYEDGQNPDMYRLLVKTLERINGMEDPMSALHYYEIHMLDMLGYRPELTHCTYCEAEIQPQDQFFSNMMGGVLCPRCSQRAQDARPVSLDGLKYLRFFQRSNFEQAAAPRFSAPALQQVDTILRSYLTYLLERGLNSTDFLQSIRR